MADKITFNDLTQEEQELVLKHREEKQARRANLVAEMGEAIRQRLEENGIQGSYVEKWPGTHALANACLQRLAELGEFKL